MTSRVGAQSSMSGRGAQTTGNSNTQPVKLVLLGEQGVGKSSIALRFVRGEFNENNEATIGAAFLTQTVPLQHRTIKFDIWDTAGQERYHSLAPMYYRGAQAAVVVYDVTNKKSFDRAKIWIKELKQHANSMITIVLAGNKADMASEARNVNKEDVQVYADDERVYFTETSAKTGMAVSDIFMTIAHKMAQQQMPVKPNTPGSRQVNLSDRSEVKEKKGCC